MDRLRVISTVIEKPSRIRFLDRLLYHEAGLGVYFEKITDEITNPCQTPNVAGPSPTKVFDTEPKERHPPWRT